MVAEERIMDVVFEIEMTTFKKNEQLMPTQNVNLFDHNNRSSTPYMDMISSNKLNFFVVTCWTNIII